MIHSKANMHKNWFSRGGNSEPFERPLSEELSAAPSCNGASRSLCALDEAEVESAGGSKSWKPKVLLVDDDSSVRESLGLALQSENFQVVTAANGEEALEKYFQGYIDLVLLDLNMPVKNGWDTFERLTALNPYLTIILITARLNQRELAAIAGASAIMEKPLNVPLLVQAMTRLVSEPLHKRVERIAGHRPIVLPSEC